METDQHKKPQETRLGHERLRGILSAPDRETQEESRAQPSKGGARRRANDEDQKEGRGFGGDKAEQFFQRFQVPYGTRTKLERYAELLIARTAQVNLIAPSTIPDIWTRHFWDSAQLLPYLPSQGTLADLGSGAGFPGLVLAIMGGFEVHLVESIGKKARFLAEVADELAPKVTVHNARIESIRDLKADVVTARALTALDGLLSLAKPLLAPGGQCVFLKGQKADAELTEARKYWTFGLEKKASETSEESSILLISDLKVRHDFRRKSRKI